MAMPGGPTWTAKQRMELGPGTGMATASRGQERDGERALCDHRTRSDKGPLLKLSTRRPWWPSRGVCQAPSSRWLLACQLFEDVCGLTLYTTASAEPRLPLVPSCTGSHIYPRKRRHVTSGMSLNRCQPREADAPAQVTPEAQAQALPSVLASLLQHRDYAQSPPSTCARQGIPKGQTGGSQRTALSSETIYLGAGEAPRT